MTMATGGSSLDVEKKAHGGAAAAEEEEVSPIEQVRLTVATTDDPSLPVWTFRMWFIGLLSCALMSFLNQFFAYRTEPLIITQISVQVASLPIGHFLARVLPRAKFPLPGFGDRLFSLNPGPFNMKEHVLISIFANAGYAFGNGSAYAVGIVTIIKAFYKRNISFVAGWILIISTQVRFPQSECPRPGLLSSNTRVLRPGRTDRLSLFSSRLLHDWSIHSPRILLLFIFSSSALPTAHRIGSKPELPS